MSSAFLIVCLTICLTSLIVAVIVDVGFDVGSRERLAADKKEYVSYQTRSVIEEFHREVERRGERLLNHEVCGDCGLSDNCTLYGMSKCFWCQELNHLRTHLIRHSTPKAAKQAMKRIERFNRTR